MKNQNLHLNTPLRLFFLALLVLLMAGCDNAGNPFKRGDQQCVITPQLKKILKDYDVFDVRNDLMVVGSRTPMVDKTGRDFYPRGCIDKKGKVVIPIQYDLVNIGNGVIRVSNFTNQGRQYGMLDDQGNELLPIEYEEISWPDISSSRKHISVKKNGLYGMVDNTGKVVIPIQYEYVGRFYVDKAYRCYSEDELPDIYFAYKKNNGKPEVFNLSPEKMERKPSIPYDVTLVGEYGNQSFMDYQGHIVAGPFQNVRVCGDLQTSLFPEGLAAVVRNNKIGFIDMQGNVKIPFKFYYSEFWFNFTSLSSCIFSEDYAAMMNSGKKWGYIDHAGNVAIPYEYDRTFPFHKGSALVAKGNLLGMIDKNDKVILPFEFENGVFSGNVYVMCQNNKWGVYSPQGECITPCQYEQLITFFEGYATVVKDGKEGLINEQGQVVVPCEYKSVLYDIFSHLVYIEKEDGKRGFVDTNNQVVLPIEFDDANPIDNSHLFWVKKDGRYGLYDRCGNCTLR